MPAPGVQTLRLRQICLVAEDLAPAAEDLKAIFGLAECHRDPNVAAYGLENVLFPVGTDFIEIVAPTRAGTAAGRFLARNQGRHGYMIIMDCADPARRQKHCEAIGVRTAHLIRHDGYLGVQLHRKDTGGAMLEFNHTVGGEDPLGPYAPAGPCWQPAIRTNVSRRLMAVEIECADPAGFAAHWGAILQRPVRALSDAGARIELDAGAINFLRANRVDVVLAGVELQVVNRATVLQAAQARGRIGANGEVDACGISWRIVEDAAV